MRTRIIIKFIFALAVVLGGIVFAEAQTAPASGRVELEKADGTKAPVTGALVEVFRTDMKSGLPSTKTDKRGNFSFAGLLLGGQYILSVSAPGCQPGFHPIRPGDDKIVMTLHEGDGKRLTEQEVRDAMARGTTASTSGGDGKAAELTPDQKKAQAEYEAQLKAVNAKNAETTKKNEMIQKALTDGNTAFNAKNMDLAIAKYTEGIDADPTYVGSAPILLNNRAVAQRTRAIENYNKGIKSADAAEKAALTGKAKEDLLGALDSYKRSWEVTKSAAAADIPNQASFDRTKYDALNGLAETYRLLVATKSDTPKADDVKEAFDSYSAVETDAAKKAKAQLTYADIMRDLGDSEKAIAAYRVVLQASPDNADAMAGLGLSLFNSGVVASDKAQMQEGLNYMTKYIETSPISATDSQSVKEFKASVKEAVDYLKNTEKLAPQKVAPKKKAN